MAKANCWEIKRCGRQPGGAHVQELGVCPAAAATNADGMNGGRNGGRICWALAGTLCGGTVQGSFAMKVAGCAQCAFYQQVRQQEGASLMSASDILDGVG